MSKKQSFEQSMKRLQEIVSLLETSDYPLDESVKLFEEGLALSKQAQAQLDEYQQKVNSLIQEENVHEETN